MPDYVEIDTPKEIQRLNDALSHRLRRALGHIETRIIGYPGGKFRAKAWFLSGAGGDVFYWSPWRPKDRNAVGNFFGHGAPGGSQSLNIDVQFNLPKHKFTRTSGGAFLLHAPTGKVVLAHRGIVTLGHGRVPKADLLDEIRATVRRAETETGAYEFILMGELESPTLIGDIDRFSSELRRAAKVAKSGNHRVKAAERISTKSGGPHLGSLRPYFAEFAGLREIGWRKHVVADCYHGDVVRAIHDAFEGRAETLKSQAIDLAVVTPTRALLFEVKTSASPQSIYTAIGQLVSHAPVVSRHFSSLPLVRVMVLPMRPSEGFYRLLTAELDIRLLTFTRSSQGFVAIDGLKDL